ncbi:MAG: hypothetical protein JST84_25020 [Acidobacteria bacterium]|nr:hypothetical protein [Acidobacteriota bacterium]
MNSLGNNFISGGLGNVSGLPGANDILGGDPQLGYLGNNGGATQTIAPIPGSVVIDKGAASTPAISTDQRGLTRPVDQSTIANGPGSNASDIGAVEVQLLTGFPCDKALYYSQGDNGQPTQLYALTFDNFNQLYGLRQIGTNNLGASSTLLGCARRMATFMPPKRLRERQFRASSALTARDF